MAADGAEAAGVAEREVVGAEAAHRDAADRDAVRVEVEAANHGRDHFAGHVTAPAPAGRALRGHEERFFFGVGGVGAAVAVEEDEQRLAARVAGVGSRDDDLDSELFADVAAVDGQSDHSRAVSVGRREDSRLEHQVEEDGHRAEAAQREQAPTPDLPFAGRTRAQDVATLDAFVAAALLH